MSHQAVSYRFALIPSYYSAFEFYVPPHFEPSIEVASLAPVWHIIGLQDRKKFEFGPRQQIDSSVLREVIQAGRSGHNQP